MKRCDVCKAAWPARCPKGCGCKCHVRYNREGLPVNANDWTVEDWRDLHEALQWAYARIAARHQPKGE